MKHSRWVGLAVTTVAALTLAACGNSTSAPPVSTGSTGAPASSSAPVTITFLEAMATGTPVVASSTTAVGETAGEAARLVDPLDPEAIGAALREVLEDGEVAADLRVRGARHAADFTWKRTADELLASWRRALAS